MSRVTVFGERLYESGSFGVECRIRRTNGESTKKEISKNVCFDFVWDEGCKQGIKASVSWFSVGICLKSIAQSSNVNV